MQPVPSLVPMQTLPSRVKERVVHDQSAKSELQAPQNHAVSVVGAITAYRTSGTKKLHNRLVPVWKHVWSERNNEHDRLDV